MSNGIYPEKWGYLDVFASSENVEGTRIMVKEQHYSPIMRGDESMSLVMGTEGIVWLETGSSKDDMTGMFLSPNEKINIQAGHYCRINALRDAMVYEVAEKALGISSPGGKMDDDEFNVLLSAFVRQSVKERAINVEEAGILGTEAKARGRTVGMCNGCFDLIHPGHVELLLQARQRCDLLFVGVNSDDAITKTKGAPRPFMDESSRIAMLSSMRYVDYVVLVDSLTCIDLAKVLRPSVYITTSEFGEEAPEAKVTIVSGGKVAVIEPLPGYSTTKIANLVAKSLK